MKPSDKLFKILTKSLPSPFGIAVILTVITFLSAYYLTDAESNEEYRVFEILEFWEQGFWELLKFGMQMMLMLVLGHTLALTKPVDKFVRIISQSGRNTHSAAIVVTFITIIVSLFNWGLGLILGAVLARKTGEYAAEKGYKLNYALIGAAGYSGLMVWHGGLSGSATLKVAEEGHFLADKTGVIPISETVFSTMNISVSVAVIIILPLLMYFVGKKVKSRKVQLATVYKSKKAKIENVSGAEKLDYSKLFALLLSVPILTIGIFKAYKTGNLSVINPNYINLILFGLGLLLHGTVSSFTFAVKTAITDATGILIQFPIYAGIMGIMKYSGLTDVFTDFFVSISNEKTFPIYTLISGGIVNVFVPSGGGQWAVQGEIIANASQQLGVPISKSVMALAYGDQLTNMLQPFWALPLLGITGLKAKEIIPYTLILMLAGFIIFSIALLLF